MIFSFNQVIELKKIIKEKFGKHLHFHDACGGQYFSFDKADEEVKNFLADYFAQNNLMPDFSADGLSFVIKELE